MKRFLVILLLIVVAVVAAPFLLHSDRPMPTVQGLPWQVDVHPDGSSRVFGFTLERSTLADAQARFGAELEIAIIAAPRESGSLEGYVAHFTAGVLTGKLILSAEVAPDAMEQMRQRAVRARPTATGALKLTLAEADLAKALQAPIAAITFVPSVNIDPETAVQRFGKPDQRLLDRNGATHFLYPAKGLDLMLNPDQKEVLQYVAPARFDVLRRPLADAADAEPQ